MCRSHDLKDVHPLAVTRREAIAAGVSAAATLFALPGAARAMSSLALTRWEEPPTDLEVALKAAKWIRTSRVETAHGVAWPADPLKKDSISTDLYNGFPGVILFHLELFYATNDKSWLDDARRGADELIARLPAMDAAKDAGLYTGLGGAVFVLEETHRATGEGKYRDAAKQALSMIHGQAVKTTLGATWQGPSATYDIISGSAGIGLLLLWADQMIGDQESRALALAAGSSVDGRGHRSEGRHQVAGLEGRDDSLSELLPRHGGRRVLPGDAAQDDG